MRTVGVVTVARSDYGIYVPVLEAILKEPRLRLRLIVGGMHFSSEFGRTVDDIVRDGFSIDDRVEMLLSSDTATAVAKSIGIGVIGFADSYARCRPDILLVLGDRFEMYASVLAALPYRIPVAHLCGGELTYGAIDDALRHSITKLSHLHFATTREYAERILQLGEEPWRILMTGSPSVDAIRSLIPLCIEDLEHLVGMSLDTPPILITLHPATLEYADPAWQMGELLSAVSDIPNSLIITLPNADVGGRRITERVLEFAANRKGVAVVKNLGTKAYLSTMRIAAAMVGNSSSGIIEAASFELPVVNIGSRQGGRLIARNVINTGCTQAEIRAGLATALSTDFRLSLVGLANPYGDGTAAPAIVKRLSTVVLDDNLLVKRFHDLNSEASGPSSF